MVLCMKIVLTESHDLVQSCMSPLVTIAFVIVDRSGQINNGINHFIDRRPRLIRKQPLAANEVGRM